MLHIQYPNNMHKHNTNTIYPNGGEMLFNILPPIEETTKKAIEIIKGNMYVRNFRDSFLFVALLVVEALDVIGRIVVPLGVLPLVEGAFRIFRFLLFFLPIIDQSYWGRIEQLYHF
jgi:hypothetical protein